MRKVWRIFVTDIKHATSNVIALVVCIGLIAVPSLYAWFNIAGSWDPYANTGNLKVAVANCDEGYTSDLVPVSINVGERVTTALRANDSIGWVITSEDDAMEGLKAGDYYAAIVIPQDFSRDLLSMLEPDATKAKLIYWDNQKENAIANVVTDKASSAVREQIDTTFAETVSSIGASTLSSLGNYLDSDTMADVATKAVGTVNESIEGLGRAKASLEAYQALVTSADSLLNQADDLLHGSGDSVRALKEPLSLAAGSVNDAQGALGSATSAVQGALSSLSGSLDDVSDRVGEAFAKGTDTATDAAAKLDEAATLTGERKESVDSLLAGFQTQRAALQKARDALASGSPSTGLGSAALAQALAKVDSALSALDRVISELSQASQALGQLQGDLTSTANDLRTGVSNAQESKAALESSVATAKDKVSSAAGGFDSSVADGLDAVASALSDAAAKATGIADGLDSTVTTLTGLSSSASGDLGTIEKALADAIGATDRAAAQLTGLRDRLDATLASNDMEEVRRILSSEPEELASFLSAPVELERHAVYPVANNGSAMAPFYSTLALWVGATILVVLIKPQPSERELEAVGGAKPWQAYFGRLGVMLVLAFLQATLLCAGDLFFLQIQCVDPLLMFCGCWLASLVFTNITYALAVSFGDVGKAIAVFLLVIQVAGSGGSFPVQMLPEAFQRVAPFLPFVPSTNCLRGAVAGVYGHQYLYCALQLAAFILPALLLGLLLRKPVVRLNEWVERQLESTRVM
ncbi:YhgE/Pip domain-containing protein [Olsenella sp. YH-ols2217]|uniref:YhgE/Pip domain-containing protein n=1 Tax=Kribbibacterium absianum TaxID=3044210 RepID=A0ABT6ZJX0_9ACTN|nr:MULTISPECIES: YhgE/Pip domain-containing protein [unclassified Olsenella]MDJ1121328.1 YhgE/Pip domain-containing protein [Olsenella sp. YH-ols2216]MDJ1128818.1 YhgE/Pip domain-containing protein [Olsenella sp. YH-ols2217]